MLLAVVISGLIIGFYQFFFAPTVKIEPLQEQKAEKQLEMEDMSLAVATPVETPAEYKVEIRTDQVGGYINLEGGRIDELVLTEYAETTEKNSPPITLIRPKGSPEEYFSDFGFIGIDDVPNSRTLWKLTKGSSLNENQSVTMHWQNSKNIKFQRTVTALDPYLFSIKDTVVNDSTEEVKLVPYGRVFRRLTVEPEDFFVFHEGFMENLDGAVEQIDYSDLDSSQVKDIPQGSRSWLSNTDKYWMTLLYPKSQVTVLRFSSVDVENSYQGDYQLQSLNIGQGQQATSEHLFFAGPKIDKMLGQYQEKYGIENMRYAIDWGWFAPLTKAVSWLLIKLDKMIHNFGLSIILLTIMVRIAMFPLILKSTKNSRKMKLLAPELKRVRKLYEGRREAMAMQISKLYKKHDISMLSMILPILVQIPIFFSVYKVLLISIEMRHAPFLYWIKDLSSKDPTNIFTLFGLIAWNPPSFLHVGIWPILVGISFYLQQKFGQGNPVQDPSSPVGEAFAKTMKVFPFIMTFVLAAFPAGLMIYWSTTNLLGIVQHQVIDRFILPDRDKKR